MSKHTCPNCNHKFEASAPKRVSKKANGPQTWATVRLKDGRCFLTSAYARQTPEMTKQAHGEYAQYRGRMEDSGDNSSMGRMGLKLNPKTKPMAVVRVDLITDPDILENCRNFCFEQRGTRQGWLKPEAVEYEAEMRQIDQWAEDQFAQR